MKISTLTLSATIASASAFAPSTGSQKSSVALSADRRNALGDIAKICGVASLVGFGASQLQAPDEFELIAGLKNPAQESWKAKPKGQSFTPGKGMRAHEDELMAGLKNPAQESWKAKPKGQSFTPGKGMRNREILS